MTDRDALLTAIAANPEDDTPRLVLADWLDEHGEPDRAAFIRVQVEKERLPPGDPGRVAWELREERLRAGSPAEFLKLPFPAETRRGFVSEIETGITEYLEAADRLGPYAPSLAVKLVDTEADQARWTEETDNDVWAGLKKLVGRLADCPWLRTWHSLDLERHCFCDEGLERLTGSAFLGGLRALNASENELGDEVCLVACEGLSGLTWLSLADNNSANGRPTDRGLEVLVNSSHLSRLQYFDFSFNRVSEVGIRYLAESPQMARLQVLNMSGNLLSDNAVRSLAASTTLTALRDLRLGDHSGYWGPAITADGASVLASSPLMAQLSALDLHSCPIGDDGLRAIAQSPRSASLLRLWLAQTDATLAGVRALAESPHLRNLTELDVYGPVLDADTATLLASPAVFPHLRTLSVSITSRSPKAAAVRAPLRKRFGAKLKVNVPPLE